MAYFSMNRNASGYKDETAYKAMMGMAKPGDVWTAGEKGQMVLILKNQGSFCNCLTLMETCKHDRMMEIKSAGAFYTDPAMIKYLFNERLGAFVQRIPSDEFHKVMDAVADSMDFVKREEKKDHRQECHELLDRILDGLGARV